MFFRKCKCASYKAPKSGYANFGWWLDCLKLKPSAFFIMRAGIVWNCSHDKDGTCPYRICMIEILLMIMTESKNWQHWENEVWNPIWKHARRIILHERRKSNNKHGTFHAPITLSYYEHTAYYDELLLSSLLFWEISADWALPYLSCDQANFTRNSIYAATDKICRCINYSDMHKNPWYHCNGSWIESINSIADGTIRFSSLFLL